MTFQQDTNHWQTLAKTLVALTKETVADIKERGYKSKTVTVKIRFSDFKTYTRAKTLAQFTDSFDEIKKAAFECLSRLELNKKVRLIGVRLGHLEKTERAQGMIW